jgi:hypothetical protein
MAEAVKSGGLRTTALLISGADTIFFGSTPSTASLRFQVVMVRGCNESP